MRRNFNLAALLILVFGLSAEMSISKTYVRDLQRFGGKAAVVFDDFNRWFASLWHGKRLGVTIATLSAGASLMLYLIARRMR